MTEQITLTIPEDISDLARKIAAMTAQSVEVVLLEHLKTLSNPLPILPPEQQAELDALHHLSDDTLWTIAREQMPEEAQSRADALMDKPLVTLSDDEQTELDHLVERADRLMLRKAEASTILRLRGYTFTQSDFKPHNA